MFVCHAVNSPGTADIDISTAHHHKPIILLLQVCHHELMQWSACILQWVEDEEVEKNQATFHQKPQPYSSMDRAADCIQEVAGSNPASFLKSSLIALLLCIPSMHRKGIWTKLNARHLGTRLWWLLMDIQCVKGTVERKQRTAVIHSCQNHVDKQWLTSSASQPKPFFFSVLDLFIALFFQWSQLFELLFWH